MMEGNQIIDPATHRLDLPRRRHESFAKTNLNVLARQFGSHCHLDCRAFLDSDSSTIKLVALRKMQEPWDIPAATALYNIDRWGAGYFGINEKGHVQVFPTHITY